MKTASIEVSAMSLVKEALAKAHQYQDEYSIFTFINDTAAIEKAAKIDERIKNGEDVGRLAGVPYALKDNFLSPEGGSTASAHILEEFTSPITATTVKKLEDEGAIMIGPPISTLLLTVLPLRTPTMAPPRTPRISPVSPVALLVVLRWL